MKLSYRWLGEMIDLDGTDAQQIQDLLTFHTSEIEGHEDFGDELAGVVTARVTGVRPHPTFQDHYRVDQRVARWLTVELFHLFGYRRRHPDGNLLVFSRRSP